jgi:hypothetical protein
MYKFFKFCTFFLILLGALNWGLVGLFRFDIVEYLFGDMTALTRIVYIIIGLSSIIGGIMAYHCHTHHHHTDY